VFGPAVTILVQLINVPIMLRTWGPELFGEWLMLSAIPTYLLLSDLGFGSVAGSAMTMRVHAGDRDGARVILHSSTAFVSVTTLAIAILTVTALFFLPVQRIFRLHAMGAHESRMILLLLCLNALTVLQWSVIMAGYRATERYATGMIYVNTIRVVEGAGVFLILFIHASPVALAGYMLSVTIVGTAWLAIEQNRFAPWLRVGVREAQWPTVRELLRPGMAFMAFPVCAALLTQGITLVTGFALGPLAVALFNPMRTLSRVPLQVTDAIKNSVWPELSAAFGRKDIALARRLHRGAFQASLLLATVLVITLWFIGPFLFHLWVHDRLVLAKGAFHLLLLVVFLNSLWSASSSVAMSINKHESLSLYYLVFSVIALVLAWSLAKPFGLVGITIGMLFADLGMSLVVLRISTQILEDPMSSFLLACVRPTELRALLGKLRRRPAIIT